MTWVGFDMDKIGDVKMRIVYFSAKRELYVGNIHFSHNNVHKFTRVRDRDILKFMLDVNKVKRLERGISDRSVVLCKVLLVGTWINRRKEVNCTGRIKIEAKRALIQRGIL